MHLYYRYIADASFRVRSHYRMLSPWTLFNRFMSSDTEFFREHEVRFNTCGDIYRRWRAEKKFRTLPNGDLNFKITYIDNYESSHIKSKSSVPIVVVIHGAPGSWRDFSCLASFLNEKARVIVPNFPDFSAYRPGMFRFSAEEKAQFMKDFLAAVSVSQIDALIVHSSGIYPGLLLCLDQNPVIKSLIMLNPATYHLDMKATKGFKILCKMVAASEIPACLKVMQYLAPIFFKFVKLPVRAESFMDPLLSATCMVYADIPQAEDKFLQLSHKKFPMLYAFSNDDKLVDKKCSYDLAYLLGASDADIYKYDKDGVVTHEGKQSSSLKVMTFEMGSHYVFWKHPNILHEEIKNFIDKIP